MSRRSTYSRTADPDTGGAVHSINLTNIQFWLVFVGQLLAVVAGGVGALSTVGRPILRELVDQRNAETTAPRIDRLEQGQRELLPRADFVSHVAAGERREEAIQQRLDTMNQRLDDIYRLLTARGGR